MEPFEWLLLGVGVAIGSVMSGGRGKNIMRSAAKGYLVVEEKTREWSANLREDFRDAVEEARYERDQEMNMRDDEESEEEEESSHGESRRSEQASGTRTQARPRSSTAKKHAPAKAEAVRGDGSHKAHTDSKESS